jgi:hypothetical protein
MADRETSETDEPARPRGYEGMRVDPFVWSLLRRALEVARRRDAPDVTLSDVLEAMLFQQIQPALIHAILDAGSLSAERGDGYIGTEHVLLAMYLDPTSAPSQLLPGLGVERDAVESQLRRSLDAGQAWGEIVRAGQEQDPTSG